MRRFVLAGLAICAIIAGVVSYYASSRPDGLERVAEVLTGGQSTDTGTTVPIAAPMADYEVPGVRSKRVAGGLAGLAGVVVTFAICVVVGKFVGRRRDSTGRDDKD